MAPPPPLVATMSPRQGGPIPTPRAVDVLSGRGQSVYTHPGNIHFLKTVLQYAPIYHDTPRNGKKHVCARIVADIRCRGGRFLKKITKDVDNRGKYYEIGDVAAWQSKFVCVHNTTFVFPMSLDCTYHVVSLTLFNVLLH